MTQRKRQQKKWDTKYELIADLTITHDNRVLHRIRALRSFGSVHKGDLGGWIEHKRNLSHRGLCWVSGEAKVLGAGRVRGDAVLYGSVIVRDHGEVGGSAEILNDAEISENARIDGEAWVGGKAQIGGYARVRDHAAVYDEAAIYDNAVIDDDAQVHGTAEVGGKTHVGKGENLSSGRHLGKEAAPEPTKSTKKGAEPEQPTPLAPRRQGPSLVAEKPPNAPTHIAVAPVPAAAAQPPTGSSDDPLVSLRKQNEELKNLLQQVGTLIAAHHW